MSEICPLPYLKNNSIKLFIFEIYNIHKNNYPKRNFLKMLNFPGRTGLENYHSNIDNDTHFIRMYQTV